MRLTQVLNDLTEGVQIIGFDLRYRYVNRAAATQGRTEPKALIGRTILEAYPQAGGTPLFDAIERCLVQRQPSSVETHFPFADGTSGWFLLRIEPVPVGVCILSIDITRLKAVEASLQQEKDRLSALLSGVNELVHVLDGAGRCVDFHAPQRADFGNATSLVLGHDVSHALGREAAEALSSAIARTREENAVQVQEYSAKLGGADRRLETTLVPLPAGGTMLVTRDLTARHKLEEQLRQAQKMEAVGQLTGGIAHDFNNLLTVIRSNAEFVRAAVPAGSQAADDLNDVISAAERGGEIIDQLMRFSRRKLLTRRRIDLSDMIAESAAMLRRLVPPTVGLTVEPTATATVIEADPAGIQQVVMNLVTNACDAMPEGGTIRIAVGVTALDDSHQATYPWMRAGQHAFLRVDDTGTGMDRETLKHIFEPFFTTKPEGKGTGLGLAMVYGIMKQHGGVVHVYSELDLGTSVKLYFPLLDAAEGAHLPNASRSAEPVTGNGELVLLVEDNAAIRKAARRALDEAGFAVLEAPDGASALTTFRAHATDIALVVTDVVMPQVGGVALAHEVIAIRPDVPILLTSGYAADAVSNAVPRAAHITFLPKPWTHADLLVMARQAIDGAKAPGRQTPSLQ